MKVARKYTRSQRKKYQAECKIIAAAMAERLLGKRKPKDFFGGTEMRMPIQYESRTATAVNQMKEIAMRMPIKVLWAHEPGEAARKRREQEEQHG